MRKISANRILPVSSPPLKNGIITIDNLGRIINLRDTGGKLQEEPGLEFYNGTIVPGFVVPFYRYTDHPGSVLPDGSANFPIEMLDKELSLRGIKGIGLVLRENFLDDEGYKLMASSRIIYHPVIELIPAPGEDHFGVFDHGIELVTRAFNEYNLSCSLTAGSPAMNGDLGKYLAEYDASHNNIDPAQSGPSAGDPLEIIPVLQYPRKGIEDRIAEFTLEAAAAIFEEDELGSIEPGKRPGLNLLAGTESVALKVLD